MQNAQHSNSSFWLLGREQMILARVGASAGPLLGNHSHQVLDRTLGWTRGGVAVLHIRDLMFFVD